MATVRSSGRQKDRGTEAKGAVLVGMAVLAFVSLVVDRQPAMLPGHQMGGATEAVGFIGRYLAVAQKAAAGEIGAFILPFMLLLAGFNTLSGRSRIRLNHRGLGCLIFYVTGLGVIHIMNPNYLLPSPVHPDLIRSMSVALSGNGGGLTGALVAVILENLFGAVGSYIFCMVLAAVSIFLIVDVPAGDLLDRTLDFLKRMGMSILGKMREAVASVKEMLKGAEEGRNERPKPVKKGKDKKRKESLPARKGKAVLIDPDDGYATREMPQEETKAGKRAMQEQWAKLRSAETGAADAVASGPASADSAGLRDGQAAKAREGWAAEPDTAGTEQLKLLTPNLSYQLPPLDLLSRPAQKVPQGRKVLVDQSVSLVTVLESFGIFAQVSGIDRGPHVTRYEIQLAPGIKYKSVANLEDDIALALAAYDVRIAPIHGTGNIGIEVANKEVSMVYLRETLESEKFQKSLSKLSIGVGKDIAGIPVVFDLARMVHTLVSGATGSGKSVCINTLVTSILYKARPDEVKLLMIDPKVVELSIYNDIPHLMAPVITDPKQAAASLKWIVVEMERRYKLFASATVRNLDGFNQSWEIRDEVKAMAHEMGYDTPIPYIVVIVDELADLMMVASDEVEDAICRLAQKARAAGIHLVLATQRPSTDVITGLIKANIPSRIAFAVSSSVDSRVILDCNGAERLLGKGDMLCLPMGANKPQRVQGAYIDEHEVERIVKFVKDQGTPEYKEEIITATLDTTADGEQEAEDVDELLKDAVRIILDTQHASASMLQRKLSIGYSRAARLIDIMESKGMVGPSQGSKPREILINSRHLEDLS